MLQMSLSFVTMVDPVFGPVPQLLFAYLIMLLLLIRWYFAHCTKFALFRRGCLGMTQEQLAEKLDVNERTVRRWESGSNKPTMSNLIALSKLIEDLKLATEGAQLWAEILQDLDRRIDDFDGQI